MYKKNNFKLDSQTREEYEKAHEEKFAYYLELFSGNEKLARRAMYDEEYCERMGC